MKMFTSIYKYLHRQMHSWSSTSTHILTLSFAHTRTVAHALELRCRRVSSMRLKSLSFSLVHSASLISATTWSRLSQKAYSPGFLRSGALFERAWERVRVSQTHTRGYFLSFQNAYTCKYANVHVLNMQMHMCMHMYTSISGCTCTDA